MSLEAIIITLVTLLAFLGMALYLILSRTKVRYPKGFRRTIKVPGLGPLGDLRLELITPTKESNELLREPTVTAVIAYMRILLQDFPGMDSLGERLVVNYTTSVPHGLVGVMTSVSSPIGSTRYPMLTVAIETASHGIARPNYWPSLLGHEFGHLYAIVKLGHPDAYHGNAEIFIDSTQPRYGTGITITFEERFRAEYENAKGLAR